MLQGEEPVEGEAVKKRPKKTTVIDDDDDDDDDEGRCYLGLVFSLLLLLLLSVLSITSGRRRWGVNWRILPLSSGRSHNRLKSVAETSLTSIPG